MELILGVNDICEEICKHISIIEQYRFTSINKLIFESKVRNNLTKRYEKVSTLNHWIQTGKIAGESNNVKLLQLCLLKEKEYPDTVLECAFTGAVNYESTDIILYMKEIDIFNYKSAIELGFLWSARQGKEDMVKVFMDLGASKLQDAVYSAMMGNHIGIIDFITKKATENKNPVNWNELLKSAVGDGIVDMAKLCIERGADDVNSALEKALTIERENIIELLVNSGASARTVLGRIDSKRKYPTAEFIKNKLTKYI